MSDVKVGVCPRSRLPPPHWNTSCVRDAATQRRLIATAVSTAYETSPERGCWSRRLRSAGSLARRRSLPNEQRPGLDTAVESSIFASPQPCC